MGEETEVGGGGLRQIWWRRARRQAAYLGVTLALVVLAALSLVVLAAGLQAGRDEARRADLALVVAPAVPPAALADHTFELYRRGFVARVVVAGAGSEGLKAQMVERGVPEAQVVAGGAATAGATALRALAREAHAAGATSILIVTAPAETLTAMKIARDQGLRAYGSPVPGAAFDPPGLALAGIHYWQYALLGV
ncbi:MAG: DUF218 domain-containing protein [Chloroflexales bacterium]|nr:DUF218 domain-containing protein [Chloroflexales bacterium]